MASISYVAAEIEEYAQDGPVALRIASVVPYYPFHGVPRFYDISGITHNPEIFQLVIDVFVRRYASLGVDRIAGLDARGFILGPPIALALKKPFVMIRKSGKLPNALTGAQYFKEYQGANAAGGDELCVSRTAITPGDRVLVIDDLVATGVSHHIFPIEQERNIPRWHNDIDSICSIFLLRLLIQGTLIAACDLLAAAGATVRLEQTLVLE
jgi:adenine phosphoribosyltransferase